MRKEEEGRKDSRVREKDLGDRMKDNDQNLVLFFKLRKNLFSCAVLNVSLSLYSSNSYPPPKGINTPTHIHT